MASNPSSRKLPTEEGEEDDYLDDEPEDLAIANILDSNPFACMFALAKSFASQGNIRYCNGYLDLSLCRNDELSSYAYFRIACSLIHLKFLTFFSRGPRKRTRTTKSSDSKFQPVEPRINADENGVKNIYKLDDEIAVQQMAKLCALASQLAAEDRESIEKAVNEKWNMQFIEFFNCWNEYLHAKTTQAFIFVDKAVDAQIVVVAFRGTEVFDCLDWATDLDFSYYKIQGLGRVHMGFLEALGFGTRRDPSTLKQGKTNLIERANKRWSDDSPISGLTSEEILNDPDKVLAYDAISKVLKDVLDANPRAELYVTGHSLGGALAVLFVALRLFENKGKDPKLGGVFTFGQPRVGDQSFVDYVESNLAKGHLRKYFRVVFRTDVVPRLPTDDIIFQFKHIAPCHFYESVKQSKVLREQPYKNLILDILQPTARISAVNELIQSLTAKIWRKPLEESVPLWIRFLAVLAPSACSHFMAYYIDAIKIAPSSFLENPI